MAKIICPNKNYNGISASVTFVNGEGKTDDPVLIDWFKSKGYTVEGHPPAASEDDQIEINALKDYAAEHNIDIGGATSLNGIKKKIAEAEKAEADQA